MGVPKAMSWWRRIASGALAAMAAAVALAAPSAAGLELRASGALTPTPLSPVAVTAEELFSVTVPPITVPPVSLPGVSVPSVTSPTVSVPSVTVAPSLPSATPSLTVPSVTIPPVSLPGVDVPSVTIPPIGLPGVVLPPVTVPPTSVTRPHSPPSSVLAAGDLAGIGAAVGGLSFPTGAGKASPAPVAGPAPGATAAAHLALLRTARRPLPVRLREAAADTAQQLSFPMGLALAIAAFLVVQRRMVGGDPRVSPEGVLRDDDLVGFS